MFKFFKKKNKKPYIRKAWLIMSNNTGRVVGKYKFYSEAEAKLMTLVYDEYTIVEVDA